MVNDSLAEASVVLSGAGERFVAGADINELASSPVELASRDVRQPSTVARRV